MILLPKRPGKGTHLLLTWATLTCHSLLRKFLPLFSEEIFKWRFGLNNHILWCAMWKDEEGRIVLYFSISPYIVSILQPELWGEKKKKSFLISNLWLSIVFPPWLTKSKSNSWHLYLGHVCKLCENLTCAMRDVLNLWHFYRYTSLP